MNQVTNEASKLPKASAQQKQVQRAIAKLTRNSLIDLIDEAVGVGCWDEVDKTRLRDEVSRLFAAGNISADDILVA